MLGARARRDFSVVDTGKPVAGSPMPPTAFSGAVAAIRAMSWQRKAPPDFGSASSSSASARQQAGGRNGTAIDPLLALPTRRVDGCAWRRGASHAWRLSTINSLVIANICLASFRLRPGAWSRSCSSPWFIPRYRRWIVHAYRITGAWRGLYDTSDINERPSSDIMGMEGRLLH